MDSYNTIELSAFQYIFGYFNNVGLEEKIINDYDKYKAFCQSKSIETVDFYRYVLDCTVIKYDSAFSD